MRPWWLAGHTAASRALIGEGGLAAARDLDVEEGEEESLGDVPLETRLLVRRLLVERRHPAVFDLGRLDKHVVSPPPLPALVVCRHRHVFLLPPLIILCVTYRILLLPRALRCRLVRELQRRVSCHVAAQDLEERAAETGEGVAAHHQNRDRPDSLHRGLARFPGQERDFAKEISLLELQHQRVSPNRICWLGRMVLHQPLQSRKSP